MEYKQRDWLEWLVTAEFAVNNKVHSITKVSPFMENYRRELRVGADIRRKMSELQMLDFVLFLFFYFYFIFVSIIFRIRV